MNKTNNLVASTTDTSTLVRAKFGPGMLLQHEDLEQLNVYTRDLSRLLFRSFFGCGVVCGLVVTPPVEECGKVYVTVGAGLALNCSGDPVHVPKNQHFAIDENCDPDITGPLWVVLCGTTKHCAPRTSMCTDDDDKTSSVYTRERGMFEIRVVSERPKCACGCAEPDGSSDSKVMEDACKCVDPNLPCYKPHYDGMCGCNCDCECILLAQLVKNNDDKEHPWRVDHRVRRFIRPVLMRDPQVVSGEQPREEAEKKSQYVQYMADATDDVRVAYKHAADLGASMYEAAYQASAAVVVKADRLAAAEAAAKQALQAREAAERAREAVERARETTEKAAPAKKAAADQAADTADKKWKAAVAKADEATALSQEAAAEAERAIVEANTAEARARKMEQDRAVAYQNAVGAEEKAARLRSERMPPTDR
jgi:hypothetical protein